MRRTPVSCASHMENIASGLGKIAFAIAPSLFPSTWTGVFFFCNTNTISTEHGAVPSRDDGASPAQSWSSTLPKSLAEGMVKASYEHSLHSKENIRYKAVPSTRTHRVAIFTSLFAKLAWEKVSGAIPEGSLLSSSGHDRVVTALCRMRGAVLKLGQMLSIQDEHIVAPHITAMFERVRNQAFAMPHKQMEMVLREAFQSPNWRKDIFDQFDDNPIAAASIGQVHYGQLKLQAISEGEQPLCVTAPLHDRSATDNPAEDEQRCRTIEVAIKVQYPGIAQSIDSDVANLKLLMSLNFLPSGMFMDNVLKEMRNELLSECRYSLEGDKQSRYRDLVMRDTELNGLFNVPRVFRSLSTDQVLVTEFVRGVPIDQLAMQGDVPQPFRNFIAKNMLLLTLKELFCWRFMQTDPNFANFLYDAQHSRVHLLDFGAARDYTVEFISDYLEVVAAAARQDRGVIIEKSIALGFLCGREVPEMINAHVSSVLLLGKPFRHRDRPYDFISENIPQQISDYVPLMIKLRLRPPPTPIYSLHRRLSGTILLATKLGATIPSGEIFWSIYDAIQSEKENATIKRLSQQQVSQKDGKPCEESLPA